ncbi:MAG: hypothetical protein AAFY19_07305 [Pseudomonadota bacterium]
MAKILYNIVFLAMALFVLIMLLFRFTEGSFEAAGARMDALMGVAAERGGEAAKDLAEDIEEIAEDVADGPDDRN